MTNVDSKTGASSHNREILDSLPTGLQSRILTAIEVGHQGGRFGLGLRKEQPGLDWQYGDFTDVFVFDNSHLHASHHRAGDEIISTFLVGGGPPEAIDEIAEALGFDPATAQVMSEFGWLGKSGDITEITRQTTAMGPYYGMVFDSSSQ